MKNLIIVISILIIFGCEDQLSIAPESELSNDNFYITDQDYVSAINATYNSLRSGGVIGDIVLYGDIRADIARPEVSGSVTTRSDFDEFSLNSTNSRIQSTWADSYNGINRANNILNRIDESEISADLKSRIKGEALFIRGLIYFNLVRIYGSVPLVLEPLSPSESANFGQSTADQVYSQVESDLEEAAQLLPEEYPVEKGRATSIATNALLGKVYLTQSNYQATIGVLEKVIQYENQYVALQENYTDIFALENEYNPEILFAVRWTNDGQNGNGFNFSFRRPDQPSLRLEEEFSESFETGDFRKGAIVDSTSSEIYLILKKYPEGSSGQGESDWPVLRYADVLLMMAEALNEVSYESDGRAFDLLNKIRNRVNLPSLSSDELPNQNSFRLAIENERRFEFACEGHRWFDLVRTGRYMEVMNSKGYDVQAFNNLFPIPQREIDNINDESILKQNSGY